MTLATPAAQLERRCACLGGTKPLPLRRHVGNVEQLLEEVPQLRRYALLRIASYRCPKCKAILELTLVDLLGAGLSPAS